ncbi:hypothetical protein [Streptomyces spinosirectus]
MIGRGVLPLALGAALLGAVPGSAGAEDATVSVTGLAPRIPVRPVTPTGVKQPRHLRLSVADTAGRAPLREYVLRLDLGGLRGVATVESDRCVLTAGQATCRVEVSDPDRVPTVEVDLRAASGSTAGDSGELRVTGEADGRPLKAASATVEVGGAELVTDGSRLRAGIGVGDTAPIPTGFRNVGTASASGVLMAFSFTEGSEPARRFGNCEYGERSSFEQRHVALCSFDVTVPAGAAFRLPEEAAVRAGTAAFHEYVQVAVFPDGPGMRAYLRGGHPYEQGSGAALRLDEVDGTQNAASYGNDNAWESTYYVTNTADLSVTGAHVDGKVGEEIVADLGLRNHGPAWLGDVQDPTEFASLEITLPDGVTVVGLPRGCAANTAGYNCQLGSLASDARLSFPFRLKVAKPLTGAAGEVRVRQAEWSRYDENASNDSAAVDFTITGSQPTGEPGASADPGTGGPDDDASGEPSPGAPSPSGPSATGEPSADGDLASTGAGTVLWIAALAALLVGGGAAARTVARRRRA